jgi:hypothetical protein
MQFYAIAVLNTAIPLESHANGVLSLKCRVLSLEGEGQRAIALPKLHNNDFHAN